MLIFLSAIDNGTIKATLHVIVLCN